MDLDRACVSVGQPAGAGSAQAIQGWHHPYRGTSCPISFWEMTRVLFEDAVAIAKPAHTNEMSMCMGMSPSRDENY